MDRHTQKITLYRNVTPVAVTSSTDASPSVVTATAHGFVTGDRVLIFGHATNIAVNGIFKAVVLTANTFSLVDEFTGAAINGSGAGAGSGGICLKAPPILMISDFRNITLEIGTSGSTTSTIKVMGSSGIPDSAATFDPGNPRKDLPNFGATVVPATNPYSFMQIIDLDPSTAVNGSTGVVVAGTDINKSYEVNINLAKWLTVIPISWTQGAITIVALCTSNL